MAQPALVRTSVEQAVATVTLDAPARRNALSPALLGELAAALRATAADPAVRVVVLTGEGPVFSAGADLKAAPGAGQIASLPEVLGLIGAHPRPVLARVNGPARAGGIGLLAACDIAVGLRAATFAFTEVRLGLVPAVISPGVRGRIGAVAAHELFLTGEVFDGARAERLGLLNRAVEDDLDAAVARYVDALLLGEPGALTLTKRLDPGRVPDAAELDRLTALSAERFGSPEGAEGMAAFREKRPPAWAVRRG